MKKITHLKDNTPLMFPKELSLFSGWNGNQKIYQLRFNNTVRKTWSNFPSFKWIVSQVRLNRRISVEVASKWFATHPKISELSLPDHDISISLFRARRQILGPIQDMNVKELQELLMVLNEQLSWKTKSSETLINGKGLTSLTKSELETLLVSIDHELEHK